MVGWLAGWGLTSLLAQAGYISPVSGVFQDSQ